MTYFTTSHAFSREEQELLEVAARHAEDAEGFVNRVAQIVDQLRTDQIDPAVARGRFQVLIDWMGHDPAFAATLYEDLLEAGDVS